MKSVTHQYKHFKTAQLYFEEMIAGSVDLKALMAVHSVKNSIGDHKSTDKDVIFLGILHRNISMCENASESHPDKDEKNHHF